MERWRNLLVGIESPDYRVTRWLFLRGLGMIYLIAFMSAWVQVRGLIGSQGILPVGNILERAAEVYPHPIERYIKFPTLAWINHGDYFLEWLCLGGVICALLLVFRVAPAVMLAFLWVLYLSLVTAGQTFMSFQWDTLLLEVGFLAIFLAPLNLRPTFLDLYKPPIIIIWLYRWLLFRLMFGSGMVKLLSHDPTWRDLTALNYHYESQPLPTPLAWYVHQLPDWMHTFSVGGMFFIELVIPFLFFMPRRIRFIGAGCTISLQLLIVLTGNYTFFNWLTILLCVLLLDDSLLLKFVPRFGKKYFATEGLATTKIRYWVSVGVVVILALIGCLRFYSQLRKTNLPAPLNEAITWIAPLRIVNNYGLFAVMTTSRPQIIIEGSLDGETWLEYPFRYQSQALDHRPPLIAPHQPRVDWQAWFAALGNYRQNSWLVSLVKRLLEGSPHVLALFEDNPFPDAPPRYIRVLLYEYRFTDWKTRHATGNWWERELKGEYLPVVSLQDFQ